MRPLPPAFRVGNGRSPSHARSLPVNPPRDVRRGRAARRWGIATRRSAAEANTSGASKGYGLRVLIPDATDLSSLVRDTVREATRSWRFPATLVLGVSLGLVELRATGRTAGFVFGPAAAIYTLLLGPLPWRALVPLEADGRRGEKLVRWCIAAAVGTGLFYLLIGAYRAFAVAADMRSIYTLGHARESLVAWLLFLIGGWGLARDIQLEQRLDLTLGSHQRLSAELAAARLDALRADLDPHFLFNALNAIASQCASDPVAAEDNIVRLATLLRAVLDTRRQPLHALDDELALANDYVGILKARYPVLRVSFEVAPEAAGVKVPPLLLQPLLENAVRHGRIEHGEIRVEVRRDGDALVVRVRSPGAFRGPRDGGMGIDLVRRRVELAWGDDGTFAIDTDGDATVGTVTARRAFVARPEETRT